MKGGSTASQSQNKISNGQKTMIKVYFSLPLATMQRLNIRKVCVCVCRQMLLYSQEENGDCASSEEDLFIL